MKKHILDSWGGEIYSAPTLDTVDVQVEKGFAASPNPGNYGDYGEPGGGLDDNAYNEDF